jgi:RNA polymerase sigma-70 factor (ECF subfamily)
VPDAVPEPDDPVPAIVLRCLAGDGAATRELVDRYHRDVFALCVRMLADRHDAEDCTQDVFIRVFRSLKSWDRARPFKPWLITITVNRCRTWVAKRSARPRPAALPDDVPERPRPSDDGRELAAAVREAVDELRDDHKAVFVLFHESGRNYEEIAQVIGRPVGTVKTWLHRARAAVLERLKRTGLIQPTTTEPDPNA